MATPSGNHHSAPDLVDDFESAFQNCISLITSQEHFNVHDSEETKGGVDNSVQRFLESARQMDQFFLTKRLSLSVAKPEHVLTEDITELKNELDRKEKLIEKHHEKLQKWQTMLRANQTVIPPAGPYQPAAPTSHPTSMAQLPQGPSPISQSGVAPQMGGPLSNQNMMTPPQASAMQQGQYPGPPASHPGQFIMPPPAYSQGPLAYLERM